MVRQLQNQRSILLALFVLVTLFASMLPLVLHTPSVHANAQVIPQMPSIPNWWGGKDCDSNNISGATVPPVYVWHGLEVCGPGANSLRNFTDTHGNNVGQSEPEFQCIELVARYLFLAYGYMPIRTNGVAIVDAYTSANSQLSRVYNDQHAASLHIAPIEGDVLSFKQGGSYTDPAGHTAIVRQSTVDNNGNGTLTLIEQNWNNTGNASRTITVSSWNIQDQYVVDWMTPRSFFLNPGGYWLNKTVTGNDQSFVGNTITVKFRAIDNGNGGLAHVNITAWINGTWYVLKAGSSGYTVDYNGQSQADVTLSIVVTPGMGVQGVIFSADVYSKNGKNQFSPNGEWPFCVNISCPQQQQAYSSPPTSNYGGGATVTTDAGQSQPSCTPAQYQVAFFTATNYQGSCIVQGIGSYPDPNSIGLPNDSIVSVEMGGGVQAELCRDNNFSNTCEWVSSNVPDLSTHSVGTQQISSIQIQGGIATQNCAAPTSNQATFFDSTNYGGLCITQGVGTYNDPGSIGLPNDSIESIQVGSAINLEVCRDSGLTNTCEWITGNVPNLSTHSVGSNQISSAKIIILGGISLCDGTNGGGTCQVFPDGVTNLVGTSWNNRAVSVVFNSAYNNRYHIVLYYGPNLTGYLYHADSNVADLGSPYDGHIESINIYPHQPPSAASSPTPVDGTIFPITTTSVTLSWNGGQQSLLHVWSTNYDNQTSWFNGNTYTLSNLTPATYYWQVDGSNEMGSGPLSPVWSFTVDPPPVVPNNTFTATTGTTSTVVVSASVLPAQPMTLNVTGLPSFVSFTDNTDGTALVTITPQGGDTGTYTFTITAATGASSGSGTFTLVVVAPQSTQTQGTQLLTSPWTLTGNNGSAEQDETILANSLSGMTNVQVTFDLHGATFVTSDDGASIVFVQGGQWYCMNVVVNGAQNGYSGSQTLTVPMSAFHLYNNSGTLLNTSQSVSNLHTRFWNSGSFTVDITSVLLLPGSGSTPTPTPTPSPTATPTPSLTATPSFTVYDEGLAPNWGDWSWCSNNNLADTSHPNTGSEDISWTVTCGYGGLSLHLPGGFDTSPYTVFTFALQASQPGQTVQVSFYDSAGNTGNPVQLDSYGGTPVAGGYTIYTIPLSAFQSTSTITGILIQDITGNATEPAMYVDTMMFQ